ncbi:MAG: hypothetical protein WC477_06040 [Patescibacteria group bacterium]
MKSSFILIFGFLLLTGAFGFAALIAWIFAQTRIFNAWFERLERDERNMENPELVNIEEYQGKRRIIRRKKSV